jgi:hypothetical protein
MRYYTLDMKNPRLTPKVEHDITRWAAWFDKTDRTIKQSDDSSGLVVITTFLGIAEVEPYDEYPLFETMIIHPDGKQEFRKLQTFREAIEFHEIRFVECVEIEERKKLIKTVESCDHRNDKLKPKEPSPSPFLEGLQEIK